MTNSVLIAEKINYVYAYQKQQITVLKDISVRFESGRAYALVGQSGSGKTTLLHLLSGLRSIQTGSIWWPEISAEPLHQWTAERLSQYRNQYMACIFQHHYLLPDLTALENVSMPLSLRKKQVEKDIEACAYDYLERVGLAHRADHLPYALSGGERQRVALARALVAQPRIILADEPTGSLDRDHAQHMLSLLTDAVQEGTTVVMITHSTPPPLFQVFRLEQGYLYGSA